MIDREARIDVGIADMNSESLEERMTYLTLGAPDLTHKAKTLKPTSGLLFLADLVESTKMKQDAKTCMDWLAEFIFPFWSLTNLTSDLSRGPVKMVGDEAFYWIPEVPLNDPHSKQRVAHLFNELTEFQQNPFEPRNQRVRHRFKFALVWSDQFYEVSFHPQVRVDVYGLGVDLAARMMTRCRQGDIAMSENMYEAISILKPENDNAIKIRKCDCRLKDFETTPWYLWSTSCSDPDPACFI